jgi:glycine dehydrogenase subunit 2
MCELQEMLGEISGFDQVALQPVAGAPGELTGCLVIRAWHRSRGDTGRTQDPGSLKAPTARTRRPAVMAGFQVVTIPSDARATAISRRYGRRWGRIQPG